MSIQTSVLSVIHHGEKRRTRTFIAFGPDYPTDGEPVTAGQLGLYRVYSFVTSREWPINGQTYDAAVTNDADPVFHLQVYQCDYDNPADGPMIEVPNGTDLTGLFGSVVAWGS